MGLLPGEHIDRYRIVGPLGAGGMGEVYHAFDTLLQRDVALKILHVDADGAGSAGSRGSSGSARILREARAAAALEHPNVVHVYDVGEVRDHATLKGAAYLAMEMIQGKALRAYVGESSVAMPLRIRWMRDVASALAAAHERGLVHRDIKPENVMIRRDGVVKVLDFGIAKRSAGAVDWAQSTEAHVLGSLSQGAGIAVGTPYYMSPEQMRGDALDGRADQFSWGVLAYELLVGHGPWRIEGGDALSLVAQVLSRTPPPPHAEDASVPPAVSDAIMRTLAKVREDRFATIELLLAALAPEVIDSIAPRASAPPTSKAPAIDPEARTVGMPLPSSPELAPAAPPSEQATKRATPPPPKASVGRWPAFVIAGVVAAGAIAIGARERKSAVVTAVPSASVAAHAGCTSNAECRSAHEGKAFVCHREDGTCAALASQDCSVKADKRALESEDTVWVGAMYPLTGPNAAPAELEAVDLGRRDFAEILGRVSGANARPIGLVGCDDSVDPARAARHLVEDVRAPAVLGFNTSEEVLQLAPELFIPHGTLVVSTLNASPLIASIPQPKGTPRLVWRTMFTSKQSALPMAALISNVIEPRLRKAPHGLGATAPLRIAFVRTRATNELALSDALLRTLTFNGKSALDNGTNFREIVTDDPTVVDAKPDFDQAVDELIEFEPQVIIQWSGMGFVDGLVVPLEARWPKSASIRPTYVYASPPTRSLYAVLDRSAELRRRVFGLTNVSTTAANARLVTHFNEAFEDKVTRTASPNSSYDGIYVVAYAIEALDKGPVTGERLALAIPRLLPPGTPIEVGPLGILDGYNTLSAGGHIDLDGAIGPLDFDLGTGEAPIDMAVVCVDVDRKGVAFDSVESGLVFRTRTGKLEGDIHCP